MSTLYKQNPLKNSPKIYNYEVIKLEIKKNESTTLNFK